MPASPTFLHVVVAVYRLAIALWHACAVLLQVMQSVMQEAQQEANEVVALLDDGTPVVDAITSTSLLLDVSGSAHALQMLIIARTSSFVLLLRLSKRRVLHLEVDEGFITTRLEVICTELSLQIQHVPRLLEPPIGMHDTRLVRYTPMKLPYAWREEHDGLGCEGGNVERTIVPVAPASPVSAGAERRSRRRKCVQLLTESAVRRRLHMDRLGRAGPEGAPKRGLSIVKTGGENAVKRKAPVNATKGTDADGPSDGTRVAETSTTETPKQVRMERQIHTALSENLSIPNMAGSLRKAGESASQGRRSSLQSLRRKPRGQFDLYAPGVSSGFSLLSKDQGGE